MAKALMIQGTGSGVGKSQLVSGLCRILSNRGLNVAPFKAQNMALNSFVTLEGGEIGRAQALQAEACRLEPSIDMNPILLKATGEAGCQVIVHGKVRASMKAREYYDYKNEAWKAVVEGYGRLQSRHDLIIIEGAGSPAEINLCDDEVVNMRVARHTGSPVILVGDIDKGGVFASLYGTIALLEDDAAYIKAFVINKFRGDMEILRPGLRMIEEKTQRPVIGVIPYLGDLGLHEEDAIPLERSIHAGTHKPIRIVVLRLRYVSNFTDFDPFLYEADVELIYSLREEDIMNADLVIVPGSKNTIEDLLFLRDIGGDTSVRRAAAAGVPVVGICGGYQMLGRTLFDPFGVESVHREVQGMGLLDIETTFDDVKTTCRIEAEIDRLQALGYGTGDGPVSGLKGYEIHMGRSVGDVGLFRMRRIVNGTEERIGDGSARNGVWGTYIHGIFDNDRFRRDMLNALRAKKGLEPLDSPVDYAAMRDKALDRWARTLEACMDMVFIERLIKE